MTENLLPITLRALLRCKGRWPEIAEATQVPISTIRKIAQRHTKNPGVVTIQDLFNYFEANEPGLLRAPTKQR